MSYSWLPPTLADIAELAGLDVALRLAEARGGERISVPDFVADDHWLSRLVGRDAALKLSRRYGRTTVEIPRGPTTNNAQMARKVREMIDAGATSNEIARATGVVFRTVQRHRARARNTRPDQGSLF